MRRIIAATLLLCAAPASANDIEEAVLNLTLNCVHGNVWTNVATGQYPIDELADRAAAICEPVLLDYAKRNYPNTDLKKIHDLVIDAAGRQVDAYVRRQGRP
jgi:hypothetical protein